MRPDDETIQDAVEDEPREAPVTMWVTLGLFADLVALTCN